MLNLKGRAFASNLHAINLVILNRPGLLGKVLGVLQHHGVNIEHVRVDSVDGTERSNAILVVSLDSLDRLDRIGRKIAKIIGVTAVETIPSRVAQPYDENSIIV